MSISDLIKQCTGFEWDEGNLRKNWIKHGISAEESEEVFISHPVIFSKDEAHSHAEERYIALGQTLMNRELFISFTVRNFKIRIISARPQSERERKSYARAKANT